MKTVLQRVSRASVTVESGVIGRIDQGLLLLVGFRPGDDEEILAWMARKVLGVRVFVDSEGRMNRSVEEVDGSLLVVSQFTLYGNAGKGRRPSFVEAAKPDVAHPLYERFVHLLRISGRPVATGEFGAMMQVDSLNDGPVTLILER